MKYITTVAKAEKEKLDLETQIITRLVTKIYFLTDLYSPSMVSSQTGNMETSYKIETKMEILFHLPNIVLYFSFYVADFIISTRLAMNLKSMYSRRNICKYH